MEKWRKTMMATSHLLLTTPRGRSQRRIGTLAIMLPQRLVFVWRVRQAPLPLQPG
jgi:hypothetical protein